MTSLLLNADWVPVRVVSSRHAILLIVMEAAESVIDTEDCFHSAGGMVVPVPSILRLLEWKKIPLRAKLPITRRYVLARDRGICGYCRGKADTVDHIRPRSRGGRHDWTNVTAACKPCNAKKDDRLLSELGWSLHNKPFVPKGQLWVYSDLLRSDPDWSQYLRNLPATEGVW